jgi:uncharacterized protein YaaQ
MIRKSALGRNRHAAAVKKRNRDAFDIFVTVSDQPADAFSSRWRELVQRDGLFQDANAALLQAVEGDAVPKILSVLETCRECRSAAHSVPPATEIREVFSFLAR